jgi:choline dehydrogenase-like flavoprotein
VSSSTADVLVVGSGASAVNAAAPLVEAGFAVRMLDFGNRDARYESLIPSATFSELRRTDPDQHRYFLGESFEGIPFGKLAAGAQLTPPRQYVPRDTAQRTPVESESFFPLESLAEGGLAGAWGAGCPPFADEDLAGFPIRRSDLAEHYEAVAERIGVSGARDDLLPFLGDLRAMLPPPEIDANARTILDRYRRRQPSLHARGFTLGQPRLALLSRDHRGRSAHRYLDMDFWSDHGKSVYRPRWTLEELRRSANFDYRDRLFVESFSEEGEMVEVRARHAGSGEEERHRARALVLAAGTLGTARIVLRSLRRFDRRLPLVCNPHTYAPMVNLAMLGRAGDDRRHSLAQLCFVHAPGGPGRPTTVGHLYSYRSLLGFKLVKESPLPYRESARMIRLLLSSFTIVLLQHADDPSGDKYCALQRGEGGEPDRLEIHYALSDEEERRIEHAERAIVRCFRSLRCLCIRRARPGHAASAHYAGTFPMAAEGGELTTEPSGRLRATRSVYLADGSVFPRLPSRGLTFTMMANADRIGVALARTLRP